MNVDIYPLTTIGDYRDKKITREQFIRRFAAWQNAHGIDYTCRGKGDDTGLYVEYRYCRARIKGGMLVSVYGAARSGFEFRRKVDHAMQRVATWAR